MDAPQQSLAHLIEARRLTLGLSYAQLAAATGLSRSYVHRLATRGTRARLPSRRALEALSAALGLPLETLYTAGLADGTIRTYGLDQSEHPALVLSLADLNEQELAAIQAVADMFRANRAKDE